MGNFLSSLLNGPSYDMSQQFRVLVRSDGSVSNLFPVSWSLSFVRLATDPRLGCVGCGQLWVNRDGRSSISSEGNANDTQ